MLFLLKSCELHLHCVNTQINALFEGVGSLFNEQCCAWHSNGKTCFLILNRGWLNDLKLHLHVFDILKRFFKLGYLLFDESLQLLSSVEMDRLNLNVLSYLLFLKG